MKDRPPNNIEAGRVTRGDFASSKKDGMNGIFGVGCEGVRLRVIVADGGGWDHVSVSLPDRCPTWAEMEHVKREFFKVDEVVMQLHVAESEHINCHPNCLHLWRPHGQMLPLPPREFV